MESKEYICPQFIAILSRQTSITDVLLKRSNWFEQITSKLRMLASRKYAATWNLEHRNPGPQNSLFFMVDLGKYTIAKTWDFP